jgi:hypothetical protein
MLDQAKAKDGWMNFEIYSQQAVVLTESQCRAMRTCEPRFQSSFYKYRSSFGFWPEYTHEFGEWYS